MPFPKEQRQHPRIQRNLTVKYSQQSSLGQKLEVSRLVDISQGGVKFFAYGCFQEGEILELEILFPFLYPRVTVFSAKVLGVQEVKPGVTAYVRAAFVELFDENQHILETFLKTIRP